MLYNHIDATKKNGTARKVTLQDFGIERKERPPRTLTEAQIEAYARRKSEARKQCEEQHNRKRGRA